jgi:hypothetical protein
MRSQVQQPKQCLTKCRAHSCCLHPTAGAGLPGSLPFVWQLLGKSFKRCIGADY